MSGLVDAAAIIVCPHGGRAVAAEVAPRVTLDGVAALTTAALSILGCTLPPLAGGLCIAGTWRGGTTRVTASGQPLATTAGAVAMPTGAPLTVVAAQARVTAA